MRERQTERNDRELRGLTERRRGMGEKENMDMEKKGTWRWKRGIERRRAPAALPRQMLLTDFVMQLQIRCVPVPRDNLIFFIGA